MFYCVYLSDWISMLPVSVGLWIWNVCVWYCIYGSGVSSLVSACVNPRGSLSSPRVVSVVVFSLVFLRRRLFLCLPPSSSPPSSSLRRSPFIASLLSHLLLVFSVVPLRRLHLGISTLASAFILRPLVLRPSFSSFVGLSRGLSTVGGGYCHKCRS
jgi:hypothetical protein